MILKSRGPSPRRSWSPDQTQRKLTATVLSAPTPRGVAVIRSLVNRNCLPVLAQVSAPRVYACSRAALSVVSQSAVVEIV